MISSALKNLSPLIPPFAAVAMTLVASGACAQSASAPVASAESLFDRSTRPGETLAQYLDTRRNEFRSFDVDGDGAITEADLTLQRQIHEAGARASALTSLLQFDLDGDGVVARSEVETSIGGSLIAIAIAQEGGEASAKVRQQLQAGLDQAMAPDTNGDGRIDSAEMLVFGEKRAIRYGGNPLLWVALTLDENRDGRSAIDEYLRAAEAAFHKVDSNDDGVLSKEEIDAFRKAQVQTPGVAK
jgi:Ca2+-binding EF-hand superfamily protein